MKLVYRFKNMFELEIYLIACVWGCWIGVGDWDLYLDWGLGIWDLGLELVIGDLGAGLGIGERDFGLEIGDWD